MVIVAIAVWIGVGVQFYVTYYHPNLAGVSGFQRTLRFFDFFTVLTNVLVAVSVTIALVMPQSALGRFFLRPSVQTAIATYIALVGIIYNTVLQGLHHFEGAAAVADFVTHDLVPLLYTVYWLIFVPKGEVGWRSPVYWLIFPLIYVPWALIRGTYTGLYPYPFLDIGELGLPAVLVNVVLLIVVFFVIGEAFVGIDKAISRFTHRTDGVEA